MFTFTPTSKGWEISEKGQVLFKEIKTLSEALAIARASVMSLYNEKEAA